jgi:transcriptional regulator
VLYNPPHFRDQDQAALLDFIAARGLGLLVTLGSDGVARELDLTLLPLLHRPDPAPLGRLIGHVARANPQWKRLDGGVAAMAVFQAGDYYVSPAWYPSKQQGGRVVPTWNYETVVAWGRLTLLQAPEQILPIVTALTERHEGLRAAAGQGEAWAVSDAPADFVQAQLKGIVGFDLAIERLEGKRKLSQNRTPEDRAAVMAMRAQEG